MAPSSASPAPCFATTRRPSARSISQSSAALPSANRRADMARPNCSGIAGCMDLTGTGMAKGIQQPFGSGFDQVQHLGEVAALAIIGVGNLALWRFRCIIHEQPDAVVPAFRGHPGELVEMPAIHGQD